MDLNLFSMKKIIVFLFLITIVSCDNGNFEVPSFQFLETVNRCGEYIVHRTNAEKNEALILVLNTTVIKNQTTTTPILLPISSENLQYRIFNGSINPTYFCQSLPPTEPTVLKNWIGVSGTENAIKIETSEHLNDANELIGYKHNINLINMRLQNGHESITYESFYFGTFITSL